MTTDFVQGRVIVRRQEDGSVWCEGEEPLLPTPPTMLHWLRHWATQTPDHAFLAESTPGGWQSWTYAQADAEARQLARQWHDAGLVAGRPLLMAAGNTIAHARIALAGQYAGIPVAPVNPRYASSDAGLGKLRLIADTLQPQAAWHDAAVPSGGFEALLSERGVPLLQAFDAAAVNSPEDLPDPAVDPDAVVKLFFTSGSTGSPKAVPFTQRMMTSNVQMMLQVWPFLGREPLVMLDWLPWTHVFGGSNNLNLVLRLGGTLFIDQGNATPPGMAQTLRNLREISPTFYCNVPAGYGLLVDGLEADDALRRRFFSRLQAVFFAAAAMPPPLWTRLQALARREQRHVPILTGWGASESGPSATLSRGEPAGVGGIGTPAPGVTLKLVPTGQKLEAWIRSPSVAAGYYNHAAASAAVFDADGFFKSGDALRFADAANPGAGLVYDGRIAEDFKLQSGTWVNAAAVRAALLAAGEGWLRDVVLIGPNRPWLGVLAWVNGPGDAATLTRRLIELLDHYNRAAEGAAQRIRAGRVLDTPPDLERGEINEKGHVNQSRARELRQAEADSLYEPEGAVPGPGGTRLGEALAMNPS